MRWTSASNLKAGDVIVETDSVAGTTDGRVRSIVVELHVVWDNPNAAPSNPLLLNPNDKVRIRN